MDPRAGCQFDLLAYRNNTSCGSLLGRRLWNEDASYTDG